MRENRPDVEEMLKQEKEWHIEQVNRINIAIAALNGESIGQRQLFKKQPGPNHAVSADVNLVKVVKEKTPWKKVIESVINNNPGLTTAQVRDKLVENGIGKAGEKRYYSTVYSTLSRMIDVEEVYKDEEGRHYKKEGRG